MRESILQVARIPQMAKISRTSDRFQLTLGKLKAEGLKCLRSVIFTRMISTKKEGDGI